MMEGEDREPGYYWVRYTHPVTDGGGLVDEPWIETPEPARFDGGRWFIRPEERELADQFQVEVLSERLVPPKVMTAERLQAVRIVKAIEELLYVDDQVTELVDRIEEVLKS